MNPSFVVFIHCRALRIHLISMTIKRSVNVAKKLQAIHSGYGAAVLGRPVKGLVLVFALPNKDGHMGPRLVFIQHAHFTNMAGSSGKRTFQGSSITIQCSTCKSGGKFALAGRLR